MSAVEQFEVSGEDLERHLSLDPAEIMREAPEPEVQRLFTGQDAPPTPRESLPGLFLCLRQWSLCGPFMVSAPLQETPRESCALATAGVETFTGRPVADVDKEEELVPDAPMGDGFMMGGPMMAPPSAPPSSARKSVTPAGSLLPREQGGTPLLDDGISIPLLEVQPDSAG